MNSSTGISLDFVKGALLALIITPMMTLIMWFSVGSQLNSIEDKVDVLSARQQQIPTSCTTQTEKAWIFSTTTRSCTGDDN